MRHLHNATELTLYASVSCLGAFLGRLYPALFFPIFLLRFGVFAYCLFIVAKAEGNKDLALTISSALFVGMLGGYWDYIEVLLRYDLAKVMNSIVILSAFAAIVAVVWFQLKPDVRK
jgi:hypothetical protein